MANWFVRSSATGTGAGTSWTNATTTIAAAITLSAAGDTFFVADDHAETQASALTLSFKGTPAVPDKVLCVDHTITSPGTGDLKTTATATTTGAFNVNVNGSFFCYGITFNCGTGSGGQLLILSGLSNNVQIFQSCAFNLVVTGAGGLIHTANGVFSKVKWINCSVSFGAVGQSISSRGGFFEWVDTASPITGANIPTNLLTPTTLASFKLEGVDFSSVASGKAILSLGSNSSYIGVMKECKLGAGTITSGTPGWYPFRFDVIRCDSANTNYRNESYQYMGTGTTETTIVRTGGATDGTTGFSNKVVTTANSNWTTPYEMTPIAIWNDVVGSAKTITMEAIASAVLNNDEVWMDVEYMGSATFPVASRSTTTKANILATGAANTTSTQTWGGALSGKFKMAVTITPQQKGPITVYVKVAKASTTVYIDPFITVT
jgi:hypothetical protein